MFSKKLSLVVFGCFSLTLLITSSAKTSGGKLTNGSSKLLQSIINGKQMYETPLKKRMTSRLFRRSYADETELERVHEICCAYCHLHSCKTIPLPGTSISMRRSCFSCKKHVCVHAIWTNQAC